MNKILSWKINNTSYGYIFPTNGSYISNAISEDSPLWVNIIGEISTWSLDTYKNNFNKMAAEVKNKFGVTIPWKDEYWDLGVEGSVGGVNIVMLSGKGGDGDGYGSGEIGPEVYEEFNKMIDAELQKAREAIEKKNAEVKAFVEAKVTDTISAAKQTIAETKAEIDETRDELEGKLASATEALDKAAALFELGEGGIDGEAIKEVMSTVSAHNTWMTTYSGSVADFQTDYDIAKQRLGEMTVASSATDGLFSRFATSMNVVSSAVSSVERTMNAADGVIRDAAEWIDTNKESVANVTRYISASAALIEDKVQYIDNELTNVIERTVDGKNATIRDEIKAETASGLTNVRNEMNALSGSILQELTHYAPDSAITSIGSEMKAMSATMSTWITKTDSAMSMTHDLREEWSIESGKISTVTNLLASTDPNGDIQYWVSGETGEEIRVYKVDNGVWNDDGGNVYPDSRVYVHYSETLGSYINQEVSSITLSVMGTDNMTAAIRLAVEADEKGGGEAIIGLVADKVVIDANIIAKAISAKTANIGGIMIGNGIVEAMARRNTGEVYKAVSALTVSETEPPLILKVNKVENEGVVNYCLSIENILDTKYVIQISNDGWLCFLNIFIDNEIQTFGFPCIPNENGEYVPRFETIGVPPNNVYSVYETIDADGDNTLKQEVFYFSSSTIVTQYIEVNQNSNGEWIDNDGNIYSDSSIIEMPRTESYFKLDGRNGTLSAFNAKIYGEITATSLTLKGPDGVSQTADEYIQSKIPEVNIPLEEKELENNGVRHTIKIGDKEYSWDTYDVDDYVLLDKEKSGTTSGKPTSTLISKDGLLQANNAIIYGEIHANAGSIGGMELHNNVLEVMDSDNPQNVVAFLNGSNEYKSDINGKLIIAGGINDNNYRYKYSYSGTIVPPYTNIYIDREYSVEYGDQDKTQVEILEYNEEKDEFRALENKVYFRSEKLPDYYRLDYNNVNKNEYITNLELRYQTAYYCKEIFYNKDTESEYMKPVIEYLELENLEVYDNFRKVNTSLVFKLGEIQDDRYYLAKIVVQLPNGGENRKFNGYIDKEEFVRGYIDGKGSTYENYFHKFYSTEKYGSIVGRETSYYFRSIKGLIFTADTYVYITSGTVANNFTYKYYPCRDEIIDNTGNTLSSPLLVSLNSFVFNGELYYPLIRKVSIGSSGGITGAKKIDDGYEVYRIKQEKYENYKVIGEDYGTLYLSESSNTTTTSADTSITANKFEYFYYFDNNKNNTYKIYKTTIKSNDKGYYYYFNKDINRLYTFSLSKKDIIEINYGGYQHKVTNKGENALTRIYSDGSIITKNIYAEDGYFGGLINSGGVFKGVLNTDGGTIKNADINVKRISGNIILNKNDIFRFQNDNKILLEISDTNLSSTTFSEKIEIIPFKTSFKNHNGNNNGMVYGDEIILSEIHIPGDGSLSTITIPDIEITLNRYAPFARINKIAKIEIIGRYEGGEKIFFDQIYTSPQFIGKKWLNFKKTFEKRTCTNLQTTKIFQLVLQYHVHLSSYSLLGFDKAIFNLEVVPKSAITLSYSVVPSKSIIGNNGVRFSNTKGKISLINDVIELKVGKNVGMVLDLNAKLGMPIFIINGEKYYLPPRILDKVQ